ncbi:hypothetical protein NDU88_004188 [Pleurodeles waltl]|uniref:Uncharacterized protein n=1 Tax=Pleurodeles waltl TaxID=8319 RepID=A0AAV7VK04_PLEWA|nr:hypothetical protein NDU88_004188 [Pleurodeles waltl]
MSARGPTLEATNYRRKRYAKIQRPGGRNGSGPGPEPLKLRENLREESCRPGRGSLRNGVPTSPGTLTDRSLGDS